MYKYLRNISQHICAFFPHLIPSDSRSSIKNNEPNLPHSQKGSPSLL